jgi:hypothetical protein
MALPILDGNQSATTLSTIVTGGQHIPAHTVVSLGSQAITDMRSAVSGSVVSISNFPAIQTIAGTVTANLDALNLNNQGSKTFIGEADSVARDLGVQIAYVESGSTKLVQNDQPLPIAGTISGTVTASNVINGFDQYSTVTGNLVVGTGFDGAVRIVGFDPTDTSPKNLEEGGGVPIFSAANLDLPISGTVTANNPSGALTTRFGSVTTANTAQLTSAVTNTSRKYLLVQNIATSTVTIGIGFAPTTTQGIQLTAGAGLTFDAFCPTGGVWWLSSTTGSNFSILEG